MGRGGIRLQGGAYQPGHADAVASLADMQVRSPIRVTMGGVMLWEGFIERPQARRDRPPVTYWSLAGETDSHRLERISHAHASTSFPDSATWTTLLGQVPVLAGVTTVGLVFSPFVFDGPVFQLVSHMAQLLGRLAGEDKTGRIVLPVFGQAVPEADLVVIDSSVLVGGVSIPNAQDISTVRNRLVLDYESEATTVLGADGTWVNTNPNNNTAQRLSAGTTVNIVVPTAPVGTVYENYRVELVSAIIRVPSTYDERPNPNTVTFQEIDAFDSTGLNPGGVTVSGTVQADGSYDVVIDSSATRAALYSFNVRERTFSDTSTARYINVLIELKRADRQYVAGIQDFDTRNAQDFTVVVRVVWDAVATDRGQRRFTNGLSQGDWGVRTIEWPPWVANDGLDPGDPNAVRIQADLDHLAEPRQYHTIVLPLWQNTTTLRDRIAALDYGDYVHLKPGTGLDKVGVVSYRRLLWGGRREPTVQIEALETGQTPP